MSSQPLTELQLFCLVQVPFTFFLSVPLLFPDLLFLSFSHSLFFIPSSPFLFLFLLVKCLSAVPSHTVFSHFLLCPMLHWGALENHSPYWEWSFALCWLWLCCHRCGEVLVETSGVVEPNSSPDGAQRWYSCAEEGAVGVQRIPAFPKLVYSPVLFVQDIMTSFDKYRFKIRSILSAKRLTWFLKEAQKTFCLACTPFTVWARCQSRLCIALMVVIINLFCLLSFPSEKLFIHCSGQDQVLPVQQLLFYSFLSFSRSFTRVRSPQASSSTCRTWLGEERQKAAAEPVSCCENGFNTHYRSSWWLQP